MKPAGRKKLEPTPGPWHAIPHKTDSSFWIRGSLLSGKPSGELVGMACKESDARRIEAVPDLIRLLRRYVSNDHCRVSTDKVTGYENGCDELTEEAETLIEKLSAQ